MVSFSPSIPTTGTNGLGGGGGGPNGGSGVIILRIYIYYINVYKFTRNRWK